MMDNLTNADLPESLKIKTHFAKIIVGGTIERPCFSILYFDPDDNDYHIGFSSYYIGNVFHWLSECFEIIGDNNWDIKTVVHGVWEKHGKHDWRCSACKIGVPYSFTGHRHCHRCGAIMDGDVARNIHKEDEIDFDYEAEDE